jgi:hypothetical protein
LITGQSGFDASFAAARITNQGTISGTIGVGIQLEKGGSVTNLGSAAFISGAQQGVDAAGLVTITNQGALSASPSKGSIWRPAAR